MKNARQVDYQILRNIFANTVCIDGQTTDKTTARKFLAAKPAAKFQTKTIQGTMYITTTNPHNGETMKKEIILATDEFCSPANAREIAAEYIHGIEKAAEGPHYLYLEIWKSGDQFYLRNFSNRTDAEPVATPIDTNTADRLMKAETPEKAFQIAAFA